MSSLSRRLYDLRVSKNLSQDDVAEKANLLKVFIRDYENGLLVPMKGALKTLAKIYGADYQELWRLQAKVGKE